MNNSEHILSSPQKFFIRKSGYEIQMLCHFSSDSNIFIRFVEGNHLVYLLPASAPFEAWHTGKVIHEGWDDFAPFMTEEFATIGANHGSPFTFNISTVRHWYTEADIGKELVDDAGNKFVIIFINSLSSFTVHNVPKIVDGKIKFTKSITGSLYDGDTKLAVSSSKRCQMAQPAARQQTPHYRHNRYQLFADGKPLADNVITECHSADLRWDIDLCLPDAMLEHIARHPGKMITPTAPELPGAIHLDLTVNFQPNAAYTIASKVRFNRDFNGSVLFGLVQNYGAVGFDKQEKLVPKLKPYHQKTTHLYQFDIDLSEPWTMWFDDHVSHFFTPDDCVSPDDIPTDYVDLFGNNGTREFAVAIGYSKTTGITAKGSTTRGNINLFLPKSGKIYPYAFNRPNVTAGEEFELFAYRQLFAPSNSGIISYCHKEGDNYILVGICHTPGEETITLPAELANRSFECIDLTGNITLPAETSADAAIAVNAQTKGCFTLRF
ncbi:MAG: hypothetical protein IJY46_10330 [Lentisphaeria bacterium]|nr:hypothetical protein [Lentisphaeria bacterium]